MKRQMTVVLTLVLFSVSMVWADNDSRNLVWTLENPPTAGAQYAVVGTCSVAPNTQGRFELLSHFPGRGAFFTRKPLKKGKFQLPFDSTDENGKVLKPTKLELFLVVTQGGGTVRDVKFVQR